MDITIEPVTTIEECRAIAALAATIWGSSDEAAVPPTLMITIAKNKGVVLIARLDGDPVGFCFTFPSFLDDGRRKHCSHMAGVLPAYQNHKIGEQLKWAQRECVLAQGIELITWTYDPLEARNGRINIHKLGAVCNTYVRNAYGDLDDALNRGIATDRFQVDWWLATPWVKYRAQSLKEADSSSSAAFPLNQVRMEDGVLAPVALHDVAGQDDRVLLTVPRSFQHIKTRDMDVARAWRDHTRTAFEALFSAGYAVIDLLVDVDRCHYVVDRGWRTALGQ